MANHESDKNVTVPSDEGFATGRDQKVTGSGKGNDDGVSDDGQLSSHSEYDAQDSSSKDGSSRESRTSNEIIINHVTFPILPK